MLVDLLHELVAIDSPKVHNYPYVAPLAPQTASRLADRLRFVFLQPFSSIRAEVGLTEVAEVVHGQLRRDGQGRSILDCFCLIRDALGDVLASEPARPGLLSSLFGHWLGRAAAHPKHNRTQIPWLYRFHDFATSNMAQCTDGLDLEDIVWQMQHRTEIGRLEPDFGEFPVIEWGQSVFIAPAETRRERHLAVICWTMGWWKPRDREGAVRLCCEVWAHVLGLPFEMCKPHENLSNLALHGIQGTSRYYDHRYRLDVVSKILTYVYALNMRTSKNLRALIRKHCAEGLTVEDSISDVWPLVVGRSSRDR